MGSLMNSPLSCRDFRWRSSPRVFNDCSSVVKFPRCICSTIKRLLKGNIETTTVCTEKELRRRLRSDLRKRSKAGGKAALCVPSTPRRYASPRPLPLLFRPRDRFIFHLSYAMQMEHPHERTKPFVRKNDTMVWRKYRIIKAIVEHESFGWGLHSLSRLTALDALIAISIIAYSLLTLIKSSGSHVKPALCLNGI